MKMYKTPTTDVTAVRHSHAIMDVSASGTGMKGMKTDSEKDGLTEPGHIL